MKRFITYITIATTLAAVSCSREAITKDAPGAEKVTLELFCTDLQTRATAGDNTYHENLIKHFDYFFFEDAQGTTPLYPHQRVTGTTQTFATDTDDDFEKLREGGYVYILANYPELIPADIQTLEQVLALPVHTDMMKDYAAKNPNGFIMDNLGNGSLTHFQASSSGENTVVRIGLSRLAVKMTMVLNIAKEIAGAGEEKYTPATDEEHLFVYFVNADSTNTVAATPLRRADGTAEAPQKGYFTYDTTHDYTVVGDVSIDGTDYIQVKTAPSYTYPQKWNAQDNAEPYYKIQIGWVSSVTGLAPYYYKIPIPVPATDGVITLNRNTWYQLTLKLKVLGGTQEDYVFVDQLYCVADFADWSSPQDDFGTTTDSAHYFDVPTLNYDIYSTNFVDISFITEATARAEITSIEYYDYSGSGSTLVSATPANGSYNAASTTSFSFDHPTEGRNYSLTVNNDQQYVRFTHDITDMYVVRVIKVKIFKEGEPNIPGKVVTITQHPAIELKKATDDNGNLIAGDLFVNGYFASVANSEGGFGSTNNGSGYYHSRTGWSRNMTGGNRSIRGITSATIGYGNLVHVEDIYWVDKPFYTTDISISAFSESNRYYNIKVNGDSQGETVYYVIGDPREKAGDVFSGWSLNPYLYNNNGTEDTAPWQNAGDILVTSKSVNARNLIAPHFLVSSGATEEITNNDTETPPDEYLPYVKRAATYQEAGYPAGRWRLPTEAEIAFIAARQRDQTIPKIFNVDVTYFAASGRFVVIPSDGSDLLFFSEDKLDDRFTFGEYQGYTYRSMIDAKFVYDLWYWGPDPMSANAYHPNQHIVND